MTKSGTWKERQQQILEALDLRAVYSELGVRFTAQEPNANGWLTCHALGRDDENPSAGVCVDPASPAFGKYHDFAQDGKSWSLFDFAAQYGPFADWKAARTHYARQAKISLPGKPPAGRVRWEQIRVLDNAEAELSRWAEAKPPITLEAVLAAEAQVVSWPQSSHRPMTCIGFRSYRDLRATRTPCGMILYRADGQEFPAVSKGPGVRKTHLVRGSEDGWIFVGGSDRIAEAEVLWKVEGLPDALALYPHLPAGHAVVTNTHGALAAANCAKPIFRGKTVYVIGDADQPGQAGALKFARAICRSAEVRLVPLPFEIKENHGLDVRDYFQQGRSFADLLQAAETAEVVTDNPLSQTQGSDSRRVLYVSCDEHEVNRKAAEALKTHPGLYQRGGLLVRILQNDHLVAGIEQVRPYLAPVPSEIVRDHLSACVKFVGIKKTSDGLEEVQVAPPQWCVKAVASFGDWPGMRHLEGVTDYPLFRRDGSILLEPGYDPPTRYVYFPTCDLPPIPDRPTQAEATAARDRLLEVVCDFPFARSEHQAAWLAFLLTPLARAAFSGPAPLFLVDANTRGSGKSLLCDLVYLLLTGRPVPRMSPPRDNTEFMKAITAIALHGDTFVLLDNIAGTLGCPALDAALTTTEWKDRILGRSEVVELPLNVTWCASGNNVALMADTSRRVCHIRLESPLERPEERSGFQHPHLASYVQWNRDKLLVAALTILRAYHLAGRPELGLPSWGSYEGWSRLVRQAVVWCGMPDPAGAKQELIEHSDREAMALAGLLEGLHELDPKGQGLTALKILKILEEEPDHHETLRESIEELCHVNGLGRLPTSKSLGRKLHYLRGRIVDGWQLRSWSKKKTQHWAVVPADSAAGETSPEVRHQHQLLGKELASVSLPDSEDYGEVRLEE